MEGSKMWQVKDLMNILKNLTFRRIFNLFLLKISFIWSKIRRKSKHIGLPFSLSIEPTTACNLGCPECPSGLKQFTRPTGKINLDLHQKILQQVSKTVFYINYYFQGEPFLHPQFLMLIRAAKENRIYTATSTNGHFIDQQKAIEIVDSGLDRLIISIDGMTQSTYEQYRVNGKLATVIQATKWLIEAKKMRKSYTPHLIFQCLAVKPNERELPDVIKLGFEIGVDEVRIKTAQLYNYKNGHPLLPNNEKYARYKKNTDGTYRLKYKSGNHCWRMWSGSVLTWDGKVVPCCFDKDANHILGSVETESFQAIWNGKPYQKFRQSILDDRNKIEICQNCSEGSKVWA